MATRIVPSTLPLKAVFSRTRQTTKWQTTTDANYLILTTNTWDDFGYKTTFDISGTYQGGVHYLGRVRILVKGESNSTQIFDDLAKQERELSFPLSALRYISLPDSVDVYKRLLTLYAHAPLLRALRALHDIAVLSADPTARQYLDLRSEKAFNISLLRSTSEERAFQEGASILGLAKSSKRGNAFTLRYQLRSTAVPHEIPIRFTREPIESRINVLIGKNGTGKTQALEHIVEYMIGEGRGAPMKTDSLSYRPLQPRPRFNQVIAVSYSPFDNFPPEAKRSLSIQSDNEMLGDDISSFDSIRRKHLNYIYCGFRSAKGTLSLRSANTQAARALSSIMLDREYIFNDLDFNRAEIIIETLKTCIDFDKIAIRAASGESKKTIALFQDDEFCAISNSVLRDLEGALSFSRGGKRVSLSAGQNFFVLLAIVLCAYLKDQSLVVIDEPETGLHPNLVATFMRIIKAVLAAFNSRAIIATHSMIVAREVPRSCVKILSVDERTPSVRSPNMETFGADVSAICNEVFGDLDVDPAYEDQLRRLAERFSSYPELVEKHGDDLGEEALTFLLNDVFSGKTGSRGIRR